MQNEKSVHRYGAENEVDQGFRMAISSSTRKSSSEMYFVRDFRVGSDFKIARFYLIYGLWSWEWLRHLLGE